MNIALPVTLTPNPSAPPYVPIPGSRFRVKLAFRVDFTNGGYVRAEDFLLDIPADAVSPQRAAEIIVSSMNLLRAGPVTIDSLQIVRRGEHQDAA